VSYAGAATNIIGGELQGWASVLEKRAMFDEFRKEQARQQGYRDQGAGLFQGFLQQASPANAQKLLTSGKAQREQSYQDLANVPLAPQTPTMQSTSAPRDAAWADMRGQARAGLGAYGDWAFKETINNIQNQEALKQLSSFASGTAGVFPYKMYGAQHSQDDLAMIGAAISSIGGGAANFSQYNQSPQQTGPGGVQNFGSLPLNSQLSYNQGYNYYNNPYSPGYVPPGTFE